MLRLLLLLAVLLCSVAGAWGAPKAATASDKLLFGPRPGWADAHEVELTAPSEDDAARGTMERLYAAQHHLPEGEVCIQKATTITSAEGVQESSEVSFEWDLTYQSLTLHWLRLRRGSQTIDLTSPERFQTIRREKNMQRYVLDGRLTAMAVLEDVRVGDTIEFAYTLRGENPVFEGHFSRRLGTEFSEPLGRLEYRVIHAPETKLRTRVAGPEVLRFASGKLGKLTDLRWSGRDLPALVVDSHAPGWFEPFGHLEITTYQSWAEVVRWGRGLFGESADLSPELSERVAALRESGGTEEERIAAAVSLVQDEVRYLGLMMGPGTHRPSEPSVAWRRRYGDCKDKSLLLVTILRKLGFDAAVALVDSDGGRLLSRKLPAATLFDHAIVCLRREGKRYWIDGTQSHQSTDLLTRTVGRFDLALVLAEGEADLVPVESPAPRRAGKTVFHRLRQLAWDRPAELRCEFVYDGEAADSVRHYFATTDKAAIARRSTEFIQKIYDGAESAGRPEVQDDRKANRLQVVESYRVPDPWKRDEKGARRLDLTATAIAQRLNKPATAPRKAPWAQEWPAVLEHRFEVTLPEDFPTKPETVRIADPAFRYERKCETVGRTWHGTYRWESLAELVEPAKVAEYARKVVQVDGDLTWQFTWQPPPPVVPNYTAPALLGAACLVLAGLVSVWLWRYLHQPVPPDVLARGEAARLVQPSGIAGWLVLQAIGVFVSPLTCAFFVWQLHESSFSPTVWFHAASAPLTQLCFVISGMGQTLLLVLSIFILVAFCRSHYRLPPLMITGYTTAFVLLGVDLFFLHLLPHVTTADRQDGWRAFVRSALQAAIWVPYYLQSKRVAGTFVRDFVTSESTPPPLPTRAHTYSPPPSGPPPLAGSLAGQPASE